MYKLLLFFVFALFFVKDLHAQAQAFQVEVKGPAQISPCQTATVTVTVNNLRPVAQAPGTLTYCLPEGASYLGVSGNAAIVVRDSSNRRCPVLSLPALAANGSVSFALKARYGCDAAAGGVLDTVRLFVSGQSYQFNGHQYNIQLPSLVLEPGSNWNYTGALGDVFTRTFNIRNVGFGDAVRVVLVDKVAGAGLALLGTNGEQRGDSIVFEGSGLKSGGVLEITQQLKVQSCKGGVSTLHFAWGCTDGTWCERYTGLYSISVVNPKVPKIALDLESAVQTPKPCEPSFVIVRINNQGDAPAFNVVLNTGFNEYSQILSLDNTLYQNSCFPLRNFKVGNTVLAIAPSSYSFVLSKQTIDPDGPGGFSDQDGDGQFDDLAPGDKSSFSFELGFSPACVSCYGSRIYRNYMGVRAEYSNACNEMYKSLVTEQIDTKINVYRSSTSNTNSTVFQEGDLFPFSYDIATDLYGLPEVCPNQKITAIVTLPPVLKATVNSQPTFNGAPISYQTLPDGRLSLQLPSTRGVLRANFEVQCPPDPADGPCSKPSVPGRYQTEAAVYWECGNGCPEKIVLGCFSGTPFVVDCRYSPSDPIRGVAAIRFNTIRRSLGFEDNFLTRRVNPITPGLDLEIGMPHDTILLVAEAKVEGLPGDVFDSTTFCVRYWNDDSDPYFDWRHLSITYHDAETNQILECDIPLSSPIFSMGYHFHCFSLLPLTQPGGCLYAKNIHITPDDRFSIAAVTVLTEHQPYDIKKIETFDAYMTYQFQGKDWVCGSKRAFFRTFHPVIGAGIDLRMPQMVCDTGYTEVYLVQNNNLNTDPFPKEIRPTYIYKNFHILLQAGLEYVKGSARWIYFNGDGTDNMPADTLLLDDPLIVSTPNGDSLLFTKPTSLPVTDLGAQASNWSVSFSSLRFKIRPVCINQELNEVHLGGVFQHFFSSATLPSDTIKTYDYEYIAAINKIETTVVNPISHDQTANWQVKVCNKNRYDGMRDVALHIAHNPGIALSEAQDITKPDSMANLFVLPFDSFSQIVHLRSLPAGACRTILLKANYQKCAPNTVSVRAALQCPNAPPCLSQSQLELTAIPREGAPQLSVQAAVSGEVPLCQPVPQILSFINVRPGILPGPQKVLLKLPPVGQFLVPGSCRVVYKGQSVPLPDPVLTTKGLVWAIDYARAPFNLPGGLPGSDRAGDNAFFIHFSLETTCDYVDGLRFRYQTEWENFCGEARRSPSFFGPEARILGAPKETNFYALNQATAFPSNPCVPNRMRVSIVNPGNLGPTQGTEKVRIVLPQNVDYVQGSYQAIYNAPVAFPVLSPFDTTLMLVWDMPTGIAAGDSIVFSIAITHKGSFSGCSAYYPMELQTLSRRAVACAANALGACELDFVMVRKAFLLGFEKPQLKLLQATAKADVQTATTELWNVDLKVANTSAEVSGSGPLSLQAYMDSNQNKRLDTGDWPLQSIILSLADLQAGQTTGRSLQFEIPATLTCAGLWLVLGDMACACVRDTLYLAAPPLKNAGRDQEVCRGIPTAIGIEPMNGYAYLWSSASARMDDPTKANPRYLGDSLLLRSTLFLQTTRPGGCMFTDTVEISNRVVSAALFPTAVRCFGEKNGRIAVKTTGMEAPIRYDWPPPHNTGDSILAGLTPGVYTVTATDAGGCTAVAATAITTPPPVETTIALSNFNGFGVACFGGNNGSAQASAAGGVGGHRYDWSNGTVAPTVRQLRAGTYTLTVSDANGCTLVETATLTEPTPIEVNSAIKDNYCPSGKNGQITLALNGGVPGYNINGNQAGSANWQWKDLLQGTYTVQIKDANGCSLTNNYKIGHHFSEVSVRTVAAPCAGGNGQAILSANGYPPFDYIWSNGATTANLLAPSDFYKVTISDSLGCQYPLLANIKQPARLDGQLRSTQVRCNGGSDGAIQVMAWGGTAPIQVFFQGQLFTGARIEGLRAGNYTVVLKDANGCGALLETEVTEPPPLQISDIAIKPLRCVGDGSGAVAVTAIGGTPPLQVRWSDGYVGEQRAKLSAGGYFFTIVDATVCRLRGEAQVVEPISYSPLWEATPACPNGQNGTLKVSGLPKNFMLGINAPPYTFDTLFSELPGGEHVLEYADTAGCLSKLLVEVPEYPNPFVKMMPDTTIVMGDSVRLYAIPNQGIPNLSLVWSASSSQVSIHCDTCLDTWARPLQDALFMVKASIHGMCQWESQVRVKVKFPDIYFPNAINPKKQGSENCCFTGYASSGNGISFKTLKVYNRWGNQVFGACDVPLNHPELGWDGTCVERALDAGVYIWIAEIQYPNGRMAKLSGDVTIAY